MSEAFDFDLLVHNAFIITMDDDDTVIERGYIAIKDGEIIGLGPEGERRSQGFARRTINAGGAPCHPGLVEAHAHVTYQALRGIAADGTEEDSVWEEIEQPFYDHVRPADEVASATHAGIEMIRNGTTCFLEAGTALAPQSVVEAIERVGIRGVVADSFVWDDPFGFSMGKSLSREKRPRIKGAPSNLSEALERLGAQAARYNDKRALMSGHVALLGLGTASEELLIEAKKRADEAGVALNWHQSYSPADAEADRRRFGRDPLVHLAEIGVLGPNVTLAHANILTDAEFEAAVSTGVTLVWAPAASMMWGHGATNTGRHAELWRRGGHVALGSDSPNWSNDFDVFQQASLAILTSRERFRERGMLRAEDGLFMATRGGARAAGLESIIGSIELGKRADLVVHSLDRPELHPATDVFRNLLYASRSKTVDTVIVNGDIILNKGRFTRFDLQAMYEEINAHHNELVERMGIKIERNSGAARRRRQL